MWLIEILRLVEALQEILPSPTGQESLVKYI